jgi:hypothetical protein
MSSFSAVSILSNPEKGNNGGWEPVYMVKFGWKLTRLM